MSIKRTIITTILALALVAMVAPVSASAVTIDELLAQIAQLQAQLLTLQGGTGATPVPTGNVACSGVTFTRNLTVGSTGQDVKCLQVLLNTNGYTLAATGAGSPGMETSYFGPITLVAVKSFQVAKGWTPANQVGPLTRAALNALLGSTTGGGTTTPVITPTGAGLTVQLAYDNPAAAIVVAGQGLAQLAKFTFVNGDNAPVKVTSFKVNRIGVSADADLANVYLMQGATRLTDAASVSSGVVNFNDATGLFTIPSMGSVTITIASDICNTTNCSTIVGQTIGASIAAATNITTNASSVKGNFPITGNLFTVSNASLATVIFGSSANSPSTNSSLNPQNDYVIWQNSTVIGTRAVTMSRIAFRVIGSVYATDLQNFRLNIDGVNVGSAVANADANGYVTFDLSSSPVSLQTGTRLIKVMANIVNGSSRNFYTSIRVAADANFVDSQYGVNIAPTTTTTSTTAFTLADVTTGTQTIASGTVTVAKTTDSPSGNIVNTASNAVLGKYTFTAAGEPVKITDLYVRAIYTNVANGGATTNDCSAGVCTSVAQFKLRNGALYANGVQVGSTTDISPAAAGTHFSLGSSMIVTPGSPVTLEIRGDIYDSILLNDVHATDTIVAEIVGTASNAQAMTSLATVTAPAAGTVVDGNTLTVSAGGLTLAKYTAFTDQSIVAPVTNAKIAHFTLTANTTEAVNLNTIVADTTFLSSWATNLYVKYGNNETTRIANPSGTALANSWSINYQLPIGQTIDVIVYADISSSATSGSAVGAKVRVSGVTANSATSVCAGTNTDCSTYAVLSGQTLTYTSGLATVATDNSTPVAAAIAGGQQVTAAAFKFTASYDSYTITEAKFTVPANADAVIQSLVLKDGSTVLGTVPFDGTQFWVTGLNVPVAANTTKVLTADLILSTPFTNWDGTNGVITTGKNVLVTLSYVKALNSQGAVKTTPVGSGITLATTHAGNALYVYKSIPTFTLKNDITGQGASLTAGSSTPLYHFQVSADAKGPVSLKQLKFTVAVNGSVHANAYLSTFKLFRGSTDLVANSSVTIQNTSSASLMAATATLASGTAVATFNTEESIPAGTTRDYYLYATGTHFGSSSGTADTVSISMPADSAAASSDSAEYWLAAAGASETVLQQLATSSAQASGTDYNVIWSDNSALSHDYTIATTGSSDWFNGYDILNLPLSSVGTVAQ
jgi:hypothetical protein